MFSVSNTYTTNAMNATKRIVVKEEVWAALSSMREPGMTFSELIEEMIEHEKKRRLVEDIKRIQEREELVEIPL
jgi:predicted CopG family antitoxin